LAARVALVDVVDALIGRLNVGGGRRADALAAATCAGYDAERVGCWHLIGNHDLQMYGRLPVGWQT
jgi:hypothetical protein